MWFRLNRVRSDRGSDVYTYCTVQVVYRQCKFNTALNVASYSLNVGDGMLEEDSHPPVFMDESMSWLGDEVICEGPAIGPESRERYATRSLSVSTCKSPSVSSCERVGSQLLYLQDLSVVLY